MNASLRIAIIANGAPPETAEEQAALHTCAGCVCCDRLPPEGAPPLVQIVGDGDTLDAAVAQNKVTYDPDQETNDLTKAVRWCEAHLEGVHFCYFAVTGRREDHTLANLSLIAEYGHPAEVFTASGCFRLLQKGEAEVSVRQQAPISFMSFVPQRITVQGVVWPVEDLQLTALWRATLNRTQGDRVRVLCEAPLFLYQPWSNQ